MTVLRHRFTAVPTALLAVGAAVVSLIPVLYLFVSGTSFSDVTDQLQYPVTVSALIDTVLLTVVITALTIALGAGCAVLVVRTDVPCPRLLTALFSAPLAIPGFVSAYAAYSGELVYFPRAGLVTSFPGASLILALTLYPYVFLAALVALRDVDPALEDVVACQRRRRIAVLIHVVIPALRPAVAAGALIVALHVLAEYGGMVQLGRSTLTTTIMSEMLDYGDYRSARSLSWLLMGLAVLVLLATRILGGRGRTGEIARGSARPPRRAPLGRARIPVAAAALVLPLLGVGPSVWMTVRGLIHPGRPAAFDWAALGTSVTTTLGYVVAAAAVATALAYPVSVWVTRSPSLPAILTERTVWVAHAVPAAILALSLVYLATRAVPELYKTAYVLVAAYVILFLPLAVANQRVGLEATRRSYDDAAAALGAGPLRVLTRITLPLALPGFLTGALLVALDAGKELTTTLMLIPYNAQTLSTGLWATTEGESLDFTAAAPYAAALILLGVPPVALIVRNILRQVAAVGKPPPGPVLADPPAAAQPEPALR